MRRIKIFRSSSILILLIALCIFIFSNVAFSQEKKFPSKAIRALVGFPAGGAYDLSARALSEVWGKHFGQPLVVINKSGAGGTICYAEGVKAKPDGYTLIVMAIGGIASHPYLREIRYQLNDFINLGQYMAFPAVIAAHPDAPFDNLKEFVSYVKDHPGTMYAHAGVGSVNHVAMEWFANEAKIDLKDIPHEGGAPAITSVLGKHVLVTCCQLGEVISLYKNGSLKLLATLGKERNKDIPEVPTAVEQGYDVVMELWGCLFAPKGVSRDRVEILQSGLKEITTKDETFIERMRKLGLYAVYLSPEESTSRMIKEYKVFGEILEDSGVIKEAGDPLNLKR